MRGLTQTQLWQTPTWLLERELARRRLKDYEGTIRLPDLDVDPVGNRVIYRGRTYDVTGRKMEVVYALACARQQGYWRVPVEWVSRRVFRGFDQWDAEQNFRVYVGYVNKQIPGLIMTSGREQAGYGLNTPEGEPAEAAA